MHGHHQKCTEDVVETDVEEEVGHGALVNTPKCKLLQTEIYLSVTDFLIIHLHDDFRTSITEHIN